MKIQILAILTLLIMLVNLFVASANDVVKIPLSDSIQKSIMDTNVEYQNWEQYPYTPPGTDITFPKDEGIHNPDKSYTTEWWYANFRLTGEDTKKEYGSFVSFFKHPRMVLFSISDIEEKKMYTESKVGLLTAADDKLDLTFNSLIDKDYWYTKKTEDGELIPFQYRLEIDGKDREHNNQKMELNVDMHCLKPPMIIGGDGLVDIGRGWSYYYSQTKLEVSGTITVNGTTESVTGYAWIDHQWGKFMFMYVGLISWEWFAIKLDDNREIMTGDVWWMPGRICDMDYCGGLNLFNANNELELLEDYQIKRLDYWTDPVTGRKFACKWQITESTKPINLTIAVEFNEQTMYFTINQGLMNFILKFFPMAYFWEGSCTVSGTVAGKPVGGDAYVELTYSWEYNYITQNIQQIYQES